jgi:hypothetical protein
LTDCRGQLAEDEKAEKAEKAEKPYGSTSHFGRVWKMRKVKTVFCSFMGGLLGI